MYLMDSDLLWLCILEQTSLFPREARVPFPRLLRSISSISLSSRNPTGRPTGFIVLPQILEDLQM